MRHASILLAALLIFAPTATFVGDGDGSAHAQSRRSQKDSKPRKNAAKPAPAASKKPVIKLPQESAAQPEPAQPPAGAPQRGPTRLDFDDRLVQGQTNRAGSVYLYDRKELKTEPMVRKRQSFRKEIIESVYDDAEQAAP